MNLLAGVHAPSAGEIRLDGHAVRFASPADARARRHRLRLPGAHGAARAHGRREHLARPRAAHAAAACSTGGRCSADTARLLRRYRPPLEPTRVAGDAERRRPAARRDRARAVGVGAHPHARRADGGAVDEGARAAVRHRRATLKRRRAARPVRLASARRGVRDHRPGDRAAQRPPRVRRADRATSTRGELVRHMVGHDVDDRTAAVRRHSPGAPPHGDPRRRRPPATGRAQARRRRDRRPRRPGRRGPDPAGSPDRRAGAGRERRLPDRRAASFTRPLAAQAIAHGIVYLTEDRKRDGLFAEPVGRCATRAPRRSAASPGSASSRRRTSGAESRRCSTGCGSSLRRCARRCAR